MQPERVAQELERVQLWLDRFQIFRPYAAIIPLPSINYLVGSLVTFFQFWAGQLT